MELYIITGASRGFGLSLVEQALEMGHSVAAVSKSRPRGKAPLLRNFPGDLANSATLPALIDKIFAEFKISSLKSIHLINNAGTIDPIGRTEGNSTEEIGHNLKINLEAPIVLTSNFLKSTANFGGWKVVTNICTGWPKPFWSCYSASKAGLRAYGQAIAKEQGPQEKIRFLNFDPGGMDTEMQAKIRASDASLFPEVETFKQLKQSGKLRAPGVVAQALLSALKHPEKLNSVDLNIKDLIPHSS